MTDRCVCGASLRAGARFCGRCGRSATASQERLPLDSSAIRQEVVRNQLGVWLLRILGLGATIGVVGLLLAVCTWLGGDQSESTRSTGRDFSDISIPSSLLIPPGETSIFDLSVGDCIADSLVGEIGSVKLVDCGSPLANVRVTKVFEVARNGQFPGDSYFERQMDLICPIQDDWFLHPTEDSWADGDRAITCLRSLP